MLGLIQFYSFHATQECLSLCNWPFFMHQGLTHCHYVYAYLPSILKIVSFTYGCSGTHICYNLGYTLLYVQRKTSTCRKLASEPTYGNRSHTPIHGNRTQMPTYENHACSPTKRVVSDSGLPWFAMCLPYYQPPLSNQLTSYRCKNS